MKINARQKNFHIARAALSAGNWRRCFTHGWAQPWLPDLLSLAGALLFGWQLWQGAQTRESVLDEGAYLLKGLLFARGEYAPFQNYGPWTNQMPLAFLIPGYVQQIFGPGLATGRYYAILLALLALLGLWLLSRRLGGRWPAAAAVWIIAWNPAQAKMYSLAVSQPLVACLLIWTLVLALGPKQPAWKVLCGAALAGALILVRINLAPVLPLLVGYIFWEHGRRLGFLALLVGLLVVILGHLPYWPEILQMWAGWIPRSIAPFLEEWRVPAGLLRRWSPEHAPETRLLSFFTAWRFHFAAYSGALAALLLWPKDPDWKRTPHFRAAVFLLGLFWVMAFTHTAVTVLGSYCIFCLESYSAFYSFLGIALLAVTFLRWQRQPSWPLQAIIAFLIVGLTAGIGFSTFNETSPALLNIELPAGLLGLAKLGRPTIELGKYLELRFQIESYPLKRLVPALFGAGIGISLLALAGLACWREQRKTGGKGSLFAPATLALSVFLLLGILLAPTRWMSGGRAVYDCSQGAMAGYEAAGRDLAQKIPAGSLVYWRGGKSIAPLLYVPGIRIFPQQMEGDYSYYLGGDSQQLLKLGLMNPELDAQWLAQADYILVEERLFKNWLGTSPPTQGYEEIQPTPPTVSCYPGSQIHIFQRILTP